MEENYDRPRIIRIMQPSYQVDASLDNRFIPGEVERSVVEPVKSLLQDKQWEFNNPDANNALLEKVVDAALDTVKGLQLPRYKIIVQACLAEEKGQTAKITSQMLWDTATDNVAQINYTSQDLWCSIVVIGFYVN